MTVFDINILGSLAILAILLALWSFYNSFVRGQNQVREDFSDIDIQLKRRAGLIDNLVEIVKNYAKHEQTVFENVAKARSAVNHSQSIQDYTHAQALYNNAFSGILGIVENYPTLKADESYRNLMNNLKETENLIARYRETYNISVRKYNTSLQIFPGFIVAKMFGFDNADFFQFEVPPVNTNA